MKNMKKPKTKQEITNQSIQESNNTFGFFFDTPPSEVIELDESEIKPKKADLFGEIIPSLNKKTAHLIDAELMEEKDYNPYIINKYYSFSVPQVFFANEMNLRYYADKKMQYDFYFYGMDSSKFIKWIKSNAQLNNIDLVKEYYNCSTKKAEQYLKILTPEQVSLIKERTNKGT